MATKEVKTKKPKAAGKIKVAKISPKEVSSPKEKKETKEKKPARGGEEGKVVLRIRVRAYESKILDASVKQIIDTALRYDAAIVGPVPLPTEIKKYTVNRASFIYKNTREQFEIRVHKRLIDIINPNAKTVEALTNLSLPSGVDIDVKML
jgi:small subunit ribosomal protein S10